MSAPTPLLRVRDLAVGYRSGGRVVQAVRGVDLDLRAGEILALVGESGSGKSSAARGITQLVRPTSGSVELDGRDLVGMRGRALRSARRDMQMVFQDPFSSLDPSMTVEQIVEEPLIVHTDQGRTARRRSVAEILELVGLRPEHAHRFPHEFSGGQRQRIAIARALVLRPRLLIADEAVSALDVSSQNQVLRLFERVIAELGVACLFITHDLAVVRTIADRVAVMYLGTVVEQGDTDALFADPRHPYTGALLSAAPVADPVLQRSRQRIRLEGEPPDPANPPQGCVFSTRCPAVMQICRETAPLAVTRADGRVVACHLESEAHADTEQGTSPTDVAMALGAPAPREGRP